MKVAAEPYEHITGARGIGEISTIGVAAAIASAVFKATGKHIRHLPLTIDKIL